MFQKINISYKRPSYATAKTVPGETLKRVQSPASVQGHCTGSKPEKSDTLRHSSELLGPGHHQRAPVPIREKAPMPEAV